MPRRKKRNDIDGVASQYGDGSFRRRAHAHKDGGQRLRWSGYVLASDHKKIYGSGESRKEAKAKANLKKVAYELQLGMPPVPAPAPVPVPAQDQAGPTLSQFIHEIYLPSVKKRGKKDSSLRKYRDMTNHVCSYTPSSGGLPLGARPMCAVKYPELEGFMDDFCARPRASESDGDNYAADVRTFLRAVYERAYFHQVTERNFAKLLPTINRPPKRPLNVTDADVRAMYSTTTSPSVRAFIVLAYSGLNISEALAVCADKLEANKVHVHRQVTRIPNPHYDEQAPSHPRKNPAKVTALSKTLKRESRRRTVVLDDESMKVLMRALDHAKTINVLCDGKVISVQPLIPAVKGGLWLPQHFRTEWNKLCRQLDIQMHPHDFRALLTRDEFAGGATLYSVSQQLGHATMETTERSYLRLASTDLPNAQLSLNRSKRLMNLVGPGPDHADTH